MIAVYDNFPPGTNLTMKESTCSQGVKPPKNVKISMKLAPSNESDNERKQVDSFGAKPPKIFDISRQFASRSESENEGKYVLSRGKAPEKR